MKMSEEENVGGKTRDAPAEQNMICAACGSCSGGLKQCTACKSVRYCNVDCQRAHRPKHKKECKRIAKALKASAEAAAVAGDLEKLTVSDSDEDDDSLFAPLPERDACPICLLPLPLHENEIDYQACCGKILCGACIEENERVIENENAERIKRTIVENLFPPLPLREPCCPFCRAELPRTDSEDQDRINKRIELNDAEGYSLMAQAYLMGTHGFPRDLRKSFEWYSRAAELESVEAYYNLAVFLQQWIGGTPKLDREEKVVEEGGETREHCSTT